MNFLKIFTSKKNEYKAVSLRHHYKQEDGGLLRRLLLSNAPSRHYGKSMLQTLTTTT
jgi:hypothetical protein